MAEKSDSRNLKAVAWDLLWTVVIPLAIVFGTEPLYRDTLNQTSMDVAPDLQKMDELGSTLKVISHLGKGGAYGIYLVVAFNIMPKPVALYLTCGVAFCNYLMN